MYANGRQRDDVLGALSHDVRQPMAAISANAAAALCWLGRDAPNLEEARKALEAIARASGTAMDIVAQAVETSTVPKTSLCLRDVALDALASVRHRADAIGCRLTLSTGDGSMIVDGHATDLKRLIINLLANALDAVAHNLQTDRTVSLEIAPQWFRRVQIRVSDNGPGVPRKNRDKIFRRHYSTKPKGSGLGLAICAEICRDHGGALSLRDTNAGGATFEAILPRVSAREADLDGCHAGAAERSDLFKLAS